MNPYGIFMTDTPLSLLHRLSSQPQDSDWQRLVDIYTPLIRRWLASYGVAEGEADDVMQEVFQTLLVEVGQFKHNGHTGAFRRWLRLTIVNRLKGFWRARKMESLTNCVDRDQILEAMEDPSSNPNLFWDKEHDSHVANALLQLVEPQFTVSTWQAFRLQVMEGVKASEAAQQLGISVNAALIAKSRVMKALREEALGLIEFE
ncbi:MAG: sigma-70 family RNA polymerase sigma factor [Pirellulaceae bacterium]|nr:sigma-70 family RNA polymerase sigma factor [Pirellulaceae bacterium]